MIDLPYGSTRTISPSSTKLRNFQTSAVGPDVDFNVGGDPRKGESYRDALAADPILEWRAFRKSLALERNSLWTSFVPTQRKRHAEHNDNGPFPLDLSVVGHKEVVADTAYSYSQSRAGVNAGL